MFNKKLISNNVDNDQGLYESSFIKVVKVLPLPILARLLSKLKHLFAIDRPANLS